MVELDAARCRLRLTQPELAGVRAVLAGPELPGWARETLAVVDAPALRVAVKIFAAGHPVRHSVWATRRDAVVGMPTDDGGVELISIEPVVIPFAVALMVGLRRRPAVPNRTPVRVRASTYVALQRPAEPPRGELAALVAMLRQRRTSWRAASAWRSGTGERVVRSVHVADAGDAGLWRITVEQPDPRDPGLLVEPSDIRDVWTRLTDLLPGRRPVSQPR